MSVDSAHKSNWEISEVIFGIPFLIGIALHFIVPLSLPQGSLRQVLILVGIVFIITGAGFIVLARRAFAHFGQRTDPGHPTTMIMQTGVFAISRNPLYLGIVFLLIGVALSLNLGWTLIMLVPALVLCHYLLIVPEEKYLTAKFGEAYGEYGARVHRWLGRKSQQPE